MTFPILLMLLYSILYIGQYTFSRLQLMSLVDSLARQASIKGCGSVGSGLNSHLPTNLTYKSHSCSEGELVSLSVETQFNSPLPLPVFPKIVKSESFAWNENQ